MKKIMLFAASLVSSLSLSAAPGDFATLTSAILNNDSQQVASNLRTGYSREDLENAFRMAQEKKDFYHQRLNRWKKGLVAAYAGASIAIVLAVVTSKKYAAKHLYGEKTIEKGKLLKIGAVGAGLAGIAGSTGGTLVGWVENKIRKWQSLADESDEIFAMIAVNLMLS